MSEREECGRSFLAYLIFTKFCHLPWLDEVAQKITNIMQMDPVLQDKDLHECPGPKIPLPVYIV